MSLVNLDSEYAAKKAVVKDVYRKKQIAVIKRLREARHAASIGQKEFEGEPPRLKIRSLSDEYDKLEAEQGAELRKLDDEKRKLVDERRRQHPWAF